jgi:cytochrome c5
MNQNEHDAEHQSPIKTPKQLITVVALALLVPVLLFVLLSQFIANMRSVDKDNPAMAPDAVAKRLKPVGELVVIDSDAAKVPKSGEEVYTSACTVCHASGAAGAPKFGDKSDWAPRIKLGQKTLVATALKGKGAMPARGGIAELSDLEVERAVVYMANQAGAKFNEPAAPTAETTVATAPATEKTAAAPTAEKAAAAPAAEKTSATPPAAGKTPAVAPTAAKTAAAAPAAGKAEGKKIFETTCVVCHGAGIAGAPKAGDKDAWAPRLKAGMDALYASALKGKGAMPPKGGNSALADADVKAAVDYLVGLAK